MNKKMEIACSFCYKQFKLRSLLEKHQHRCNENTIHKLKERVRVLELKLQEAYGTPEISFQKYAEQITAREDVTNEKASAIFINAFKKWFEKGVEKGCVKLDEKMVFDETYGWILFKKIPSDCIEKIFRTIQSNLLTSLKKDEDYYKNVVKLTRAKKWPNIYKYI